MQFGGSHDIAARVACGLELAGVNVLFEWQVRQIVMRPRTMMYAYVEPVDESIESVHLLLALGHLADWRSVKLNFISHLTHMARDRCEA
jgi:hypothetical protein